MCFRWASWWRKSASCSTFAYEAKNIQLISVGSEKAAKVLTPSGCIAGKRRVGASVLAWGARVDRRGREAAKRIYLRLGRSDGHEPCMIGHWSMDYSSTFARVLACYSPEVDRSIQAPSFEQPRTVCVREETSCLETSEDALRSLMCDFFFLNKCSDWTWCANSDSSLLADWKWTHGRVLSVAEAFFCSCCLLVAVVWHQKLMWLGNGAHITEEWRLNTNKQKKMQNSRTTLWSCLCIAVNSFSLSLFSLFLSFSFLLWSEMGHKTSILISRCRGASTGPSWPGMKSSSRLAEVRESRDSDALSSYGFYPASCPLALLVIPLSCFGAAVLFSCCMSKTKSLLISKNALGQGF